MELIDLVRRTDWYRGSSPRPDGRRLHKEWQHVNVIGDGIEAYVNLNIMDDQRPAARPGAPWSPGSRARSRCPSPSP